jgi:hypothetical protein
MLDSSPPRLVPRSERDAWLGVVGVHHDWTVNAKISWRIPEYSIVIAFCTMAPATAMALTQPAKLGRGLVVHPLVADSLAVFVDAFIPDDRPQLRGRDRFTVG